MRKHKELYESRISTARWIAYDIPGNIGWIAFLAGLGLCLSQRPEAAQHPVIAALLWPDLCCGLAMVVAIGELISERIQGLDRILPKTRLLRGFGTLTVAGGVGLAVSAVMLIMAIRMQLGGAPYLLVLCAGGLLCALFGGLLWREYRKI